jgi:hypothetical protein
MWEPTRRRGTRSARSARVPAFRDSCVFYTAMALSWSGYPEIKIYR